MNKCIIRNKVVSCVSSRICQYTGTDMGLESAVQVFGIEDVLRSIFSENETYTKLGVAVKAFTQGDHNDLFSWMYKIQTGFGVIIDSHITLCRYDVELFEEQQAIFGWAYVDSQKYLGDTWWFEDQEIMKDIKQLPVISFFEKYKGI